jgi:bis(5'-nucleosyl)-tetraphosphatase (symmetrical)
VRWIVGDIQGCARELERLLREIRYDAAADELWSLGDLVNRGPESLETLRLWRDVGGHAVLGNHDVYAVRAFSGGIRRRGSDTLDALFEAPDAEELFGLLAGLPVLVRLSGNGETVPDVWAVHGGLHPSWTDLEQVARRLAAGTESAGDRLESRELSWAINLRCCTAEGETLRFTGPPEECPAPYRPWDEFYRGETMVVHGHWARRGYYRTARTMGLDSGCVYGGTLTAWCQDEDRIVQVGAIERGER